MSRSGSSGRLPRLITGVLLVVALTQAVALFWLGEEGHSAYRYLPLLPRQGAATSSRALEAPGATGRAARARLASLGAVLTVEDIARGLLHLMDDRCPTPLTASQRRSLLPLVKEVHALRLELLRAEGVLGQQSEAARRLGAKLMARLDEAQRREMRAGRDQVSILQVEEAYWRALINSLEAEAP